MMVGTAVEIMLIQIIVMNVYALSELLVMWSKMFDILCKQFYIFAFVILIKLGLVMVTLMIAVDPLSTR